MTGNQRYYGLIAYIAALFLVGLLASGCSIKASEVKKCITVCETNGGVKEINWRTVQCLCVNGAAFSYSGTIVSPSCGEAE